MAYFAQTTAIITPLVPKKKKIFFKKTRVFVSQGDFGKDISTFCWNALFLVTRKVHCHERALYFKKAHLFFFLKTCAFVHLFIFVSPILLFFFESPFHNE